MRDQIIELLRKELIGPDPCDALIQDNGEEILQDFDRPTSRYVSGALFPRDYLQRKTEESESDDISIKDIDEHEEDNFVEDSQHSKSSVSNKESEEDEVLNLANSFLPSAAGMSVFMEYPDKGIKVMVNMGIYNKQTYETKDKDGNTVEKTGWFRQQINFAEVIPRSSYPSENKKAEKINIYDDDSRNLVLELRNRSKKNHSKDLITFSLINESVSDATGSEDGKVFFQVELKLSSADDSKCFYPMPDYQHSINDDDEKSNQLLYRKKKSFGAGHGCSVKWDSINDPDQISLIESTYMPSYELKPIIPRSFENIEISMFEFSDLGNKENIFTNLKLLIDQYSKWIDKIRSNITSLVDDDKITAEKHMDSCELCLKRMSKGLMLLKDESNPDILKSFQLMNRAMLLQQVRYSLKKSEWKKDKNNNYFVDIAYESQPDLSRPDTWPDWNPEKGINERLGNWRPFQIAFILMNIASIVDHEDPEHDIIDLIWFPTGGGKTEAYLGMSAFLIFYKKLSDMTHDGTLILMRYTLRLLTNQQFQRASSLITACEFIRQEIPNELGDNAITIGLWAGRELTPNSRSDAVYSYNKLSQRKSNENPFLILSCPWCGTRFGKILGRIRGYYKSSRPRTVKYVCENSDCHFSDRNKPLPLTVIDQDIYENPPTLVLGTVDKFSLIPWKPQSQRLFGIKDSVQVTSPPELIIQDELHLISGPLGSMVGHYETLIFELCKNKVTEKGPKIIASTATISRAKEQCNQLYGTDKNKILQFPPQGLDAGDSFFAFQDNNKQGRVYIGVATNTGKTHPVVQKIVHASLLQSFKSCNSERNVNKDPYYTLINYYNSIRELGSGATQISADIPEYLNALWLRKGIKKGNKNDPRRFINHHIELTSRVPGYLVTDYLDRLNTTFYNDQDKNAVDVCLATNMISVGLDVPRLGLMTVVGQPKTASEYIQATSRVGRSADGPGLVVTIFNNARPRDKSHYENFLNFHSKLYAKVEPTSVTPFSAPVRERALHAIMVGLIRNMFGSHTKYATPCPSEKMFDFVKDIIKTRVESIDPEELSGCMKLLDERSEEWSRYGPQKYGNLGNINEELTLMYPYGEEQPKEWLDKSWPTPTSMRNVDKTCEAQIIAQYPESEHD